MSIRSEGDWRVKAVAVVKFFFAAFAVFLASCDQGASDSDREVSFGGLFSKKQVTKDRGYFYRIQSSYTVKETGEPIDFDFVVACGATVTHWRYTGPSTRVSTHPLVMIKATSNGGAVLLRSYRALCEQGVKWGPNNEYGAPDDLLPFIIWFDDVKDLSFGWGYATEDAYYNTNSKLEFRGASATESNYKEWKAWRKKAAKNYKQVGQLPGPWGYSYSNGPKAQIKRIKALHANGEEITNECSGYVRIPAPKEVIEKIWSSAPDYNPPPPDGARYFPLFGAQGWALEIIEEAGPVFGGRKFSDYAGNPNLRSLGAINRNNSGFIRTSAGKTKVIGDHFPLLPRSQSSKAPVTEPTDVYPRRILVGDEWKGMIACGGDFFVPGPDYLAVTRFDDKRPKGERVIIIREESFDPDWKSKTFPLYVNDEAIVENLMDQAYYKLAAHFIIVDRHGYILDRAPWGFGGP